MKRIAVVTTLSLAMLAGLGSIAIADDGTPGDCPAIASGAEFGEHVSMHAQTMGGFDGMMNPGMHQGYSTFR